jgi:hypothetical protein
MIGIRQVVNCATALIVALVPLLSKRLRKRFDNYKL